MAHPIQETSDHSHDHREMTLGEYRVGISFNPSHSPTVDALKRAAAFFIDLCEDLRGTEGPTTAEVGRLISLAQTHAEDAAMWAVKAATKQPR